MILFIFLKTYFEHESRAYNFTQEFEILIYMSKHIHQPQCQNDLGQVNTIKLKYIRLAFSKSYLIIKNNYFSKQKKKNPIS